MYITPRHVSDLRFEYYFQIVVTMPTVIPLKPQSTEYASLTAAVTLTSLRFYFFIKRVRLRKIDKVVLASPVKCL